MTSNPNKLRPIRRVIVMIKPGTDLDDGNVMTWGKSADSVLRYMLVAVGIFNPSLWCKANYNATSNNIKLVQWMLMGGLLHLVQ